MKQLKSFTEANCALAQFIPNSRVAGSYTLERPLALMDYLGNPQNLLKVVHVAGTSGKTSTSYYAAALLSATGKKVGLTVSPHVNEVNDRLQINLKPMAETEFCSELSEFLALIETSKISPSYFECLVAFAYWEFVRQKVDYAVIEVGLGGKFDGTNVISRADKVCIITDIGLDHVQVLGNTIAEITSQKAGIIQPQNAVFTYRQTNEITDIINQQCAHQYAELHLIEPLTSVVSDLSFLPLFQQRNFYLAQQAVNYTIERDSILQLSPRSVIAAAKTHIPARMETFNYKDKIIILDGAHNAQKLHALVESISSKYSGQSAAAMISFSALNASTRLNDGLQEISRLVKHVIVTEFGVDQDIHQQSVEAEVITHACQEIGLKSIVIRDPIAAFKALLTSPEKILLVTGSFYLLNPVRPYVLNLTG
jgi:dihydrofolate synthase/folylpolyglutamate synthase